MSNVAEGYEDHFTRGGADQARISMIGRHVKLLRRAIPADFSA